MLIRYRILVTAILFGVTAYFALGQTTIFDELGLLVWRTGEQQLLIGPSWLPSALRDITAIGSNWLIVYFIALAVVILLITKHSAHALVLSVMVMGGLIVSMGSKYIFLRPRPDLVETLTHVYTPSFPSGHATMSMVCFLGAALVCGTLNDSLRLRKSMVGIALLTTLLVGASRVALGVHWPTDVIGGWLLGGFWVGIVYELSRKRLN